MSLRGNQLSGSLRNELGNQLVQIDLSNNMFTGSIPDVFGGLRRLKSLNLASNMFNGTLPASLSRCPMLKVVVLRNNTLSGEITIDFTLLQSLNNLDVGGNYLSGSVPTGLGWCTQLRTLNLAKNKFVGEIPESFKNLRSLSYLSLTGNGFTNLSTALQVLHHLPNLTSLVLTKNFLGGETMPMDGIMGSGTWKCLPLLIVHSWA